MELGGDRSTTVEAGPPRSRSCTAAGSRIRFSSAQGLRLCGAALASRLWCWRARFHPRRGGRGSPPSKHNKLDGSSFTAERVERLHDAIGDILDINVDRAPLLWGFSADISTTLAALRGLEQMMLDMYEAPGELHKLLAFMRDGVLANQTRAEEAGDLTLTCGHNQAAPYAMELESPHCNSGPRKRSDLWGFAAAQEFTLVSPQHHEEFLFQYQMPIMEPFGLVHYGCCEDLTRKIDMLRKLPNLRSIAVTPRADVRACAEQIGADYVISWRPNPTDMVCAGWDEDRIRRIIRHGLDVCGDGIMHVNLKDIETVQHEPGRLARWVRVVRDEIDARG